MNNPYTIFLCPSSKECPWEGYKEEIVPHFEKDHKEQFLQSATIPITRLSNQPVYTYLIEQKEKVFLVQLHKHSDEKFKVKLRYLGPEDEAIKFKYYVEVVSRNFSFSHKNSSLVVQAEDGSTEIDLESILMYENVKVSKVFFKIHIDHPELIFRDEDVSFYEDIVSVKSFEIDFSSNDSDEIGNKVINICESINETFVDSPQKNPLNYQESFGLRRIFQEEEHEGLLEVHHTFLPDRSLSISKSMKKSLTCRKCNEVMRPPIFMCSYGHVVCGNCKTEICDKCDAKITLRNDDLEERSRRVHHKCVFANYCGFDHLPFAEVRPHETKCKFMSYECPLDSFRGNFEEVQLHVKAYHHDIPARVALSNSYSKNTKFIILNDYGVLFVQCIQKLSSIVWRVLDFSERPSFYRIEVCYTCKKNKATTIELKRLSAKEYCLTEDCGIKDKKSKGKITVFIE